MQTRRIGQLEVSLIGLGCNNFGRRIDRQATQEVVDAALAAGVTLFDTADVYGGDGASERLLGEALGDRRDQVVIATKFGMRLDDERQGAHPDYVRSACDASLQRLGTDHIDLYQMHRPDPDVPIEETIGALDELVAAGKIREIGHSNMTGPLIRQAEAAASAAGTARFVCAQEQWNLLDREIEDDIVPAVAELGLRLLPFYPLAAGMLTGKYRAGQAPDPSWRIAGFDAERQERLLAAERLAKVEALETFAGDAGHTLLELACSWLAAQPVVASVIAGASNAAQVEANVAAASWELTDDDLAEINGITGR